MGGTKCLRLGTCELECMGGVLQNDLSITPPNLKTQPPRALPSRRAHLTYPKSIQDPCLRSLLTVTYALKVVTFRPNSEKSKLFKAGQFSSS